MIVGCSLSVDHPTSNRLTLYFILNIAKYTQRQKLSITNFVAKFFRARLCDVNKPYLKITASYRDKIVKQSHYFTILVCDRQFNKKHIGVTLFSLKLCVRE